MYIAKFGIERWIPNFNIKKHVCLFFCNLDSCFLQKETNAPLQDVPVKDMLQDCILITGGKFLHIFMLIFT